MLKICHLTSVHNRYDTRIFQKQCRSLAKSGYDITLICIDNLGNEVIDGVKIISAKVKAKFPLMRVLKAPMTIYRIALLCNSEIYQIHDPELLPVGLRLKRAGKKVIYDSHEDFPNQLLEKEWIPLILRRIFSVSAKIYMKIVLKKIDAVLTVTPHIVEKLRNITSSVYLVTNYPIVEDKLDDITLETYLSRDNKLCYSGTVYNDSSQEEIIEAIENISDIRYIIVGSITKEYLLKLRKVDRCSKIDYLGRVSKTELNEIYNAVTIGIILVDYSDKFGGKMGTLGINKLFEYMLFGLPVICTDFTLWKEIMDKYKCGLYVNPNNSEEIANAIHYLIEHKNEAYRMGQNGRKAIFEEFNWKSQERTYLGIVEKIGMMG
jgi:glycosyltransferase involved in cell wall biosynthesis